MRTTAPPPSAGEFALLRLVELAKSRQHGSITEKQYVRLRRQYLGLTPPTAPLFGWYYGRTAELRAALIAHGVRIRSVTPQRLHRYKLAGTGIGSMDEIDSKIRKSQERPGGQRLLLDGRRWQRSLNLNSIEWKVGRWKRGTVLCSASVRQMDSRLPEATCTWRNSTFSSLVHGHTRLAY
jgi:hypothetical protein